VYISYNATCSNHDISHTLCREDIMNTIQIIGTQICRQCTENWTW